MTIKELKVFMADLPDETVIFACEENYLYPCEAHYGDPKHPVGDGFALSYAWDLDHSKPVLWFS